MDDSDLIAFLDDLDTLQAHHGQAGAAARLGVDPRTLRRWMRRHTRPTGALVRLARWEAQAAARRLGMLCADWEGFYIGRDGRLHSDDWAYSYSPTDVTGIYWLREIDRSQRARIRALEQLVLELQEQPAPSSAPVRVVDCRQDSG